MPDTADESAPDTKVGTTIHQEMPLLDPSEAQRLSRLRILLADTRHRIGDESELGVHTSVLAVDGMGELAIGLCLHRRGVTSKQGDGVPARLALLLKDLDSKVPGTQGFRELHRMRNLVQHEGILPAANQLPRWLSETEKMVDALVFASFGIGLTEIGSASGVEDETLREGLQRAEHALEHGDAEESFEASWTALEIGRRQFRDKTGLNPAAGTSHISTTLRRLDRELGNLADTVGSLASQIELSAFTPDLGEWLWLRQRQDEKLRGLPPARSDADRAFVFVLSWVLRFESYIARHGVDRWELWGERQRAPVTGVPDGPHIRNVELGDRPSAPGGNTDALRNWIFELTDVPETQPSFDWAIFAVASELDSSAITHAWLDDRGHLSVTCPSASEPEAIKSSVEKLIAESKEKLRVRSLEDAEDAVAEKGLIEHFRGGLDLVACPVERVSIQMPREKYRIDPAEALVFIEITPSNESHSWLTKGLDESFGTHFPELADREKHAPPAYQTGWNSVSVPAQWEPQRVGKWIVDAATFDARKLNEELQASQARKAEIESSLTDLRMLIRDGN